MKPDSPLQIISLFGIIFSVAAQLALYIFDKEVKNMWFLYPTWVAIYIAGGILKRFIKLDHHHHDHDHDHDDNHHDH